MRLLPLVLGLLASCGGGSSGEVTSGPIGVPSFSAPRIAPPVPPQATETLRVMSYNLNFGVAGDPDGARAIASVAPEIVLLQESTDEWEAALVGSLDYPHHQFLPPVSPWAASGLGILSRYPIETAEVLPTRAGLFAAWRIVVATPLGRVQLVNVHLRPPMSESGSWVAGYFSTREPRRDELAEHLDRIDPALPTIIAGDFNEEGTGLALQLAESHRFTDAIHQFAGATRTWHWPVGSIELRFQLDHILYNYRQWIAVAGGIVEAGHSDHFPVWTELAPFRE